MSANLSKLNLVNKMDNTFLQWIFLVRNPRNPNDSIDSHSQISVTVLFQYSYLVDLQSGTQLIFDRSLRSFDFTLYLSLLFQFFCSGVVNTAH